MQLSPMLSVFWHKYVQVITLIWGNEEDNYVNKGFDSICREMIWMPKCENKLKKWNEMKLS